MTGGSSLVHAIFDQAFNHGDLAIVDELISIDSPTHMPGWGMPANRLGFKQMIVSLRTAFPDLHCTIDDEIEEARKFAALWTMCGTQKGSFLGNSPTRRRVEVQGFLFAYTEDRWITEGWLLIDQMSMLQQIGAVPPPRGKP